MSLPAFVSIGGQGALRLRGNQYYRDGGAWGIGFSLQADGTMLAVGDSSMTDHLHGLKLVPISEAKWREDNRNYVPSEVEIAASKKQAKEANNVAV